MAKSVDDGIPEVSNPKSLFKEPVIIKQFKACDDEVKVAVAELVYPFIRGNAFMLWTSGVASMPLDAVKLALTKSSAGFDLPRSNDKRFIDELVKYFKEEIT